MVNYTGNLSGDSKLGVGGKPAPLTEWSKIAEESSGCDKSRGERPLRRLLPGDRFELHLPTSGRTWLGTVIASRYDTVAVIMDGRETEKYFKTKEGKEVILQQMGGVEYWPGSAPVRPLGEKRDISRWKANKAGAIQDTDPQQGDTKTKEEEEQMAKVANLAKTANDEPPITAGQVKERKLTAVKKPKAPKELHPCLCGCGEMVTGRFRMGHDGRYYGLLNRVVNDKMKFNELPAKMQADVKTKANAEKIVAEHYRKVTKTA